MQLFRLGLYLLGNAEVDGEYFEVIRGTPMDLNLKKLSAAELKAMHLRLFAIHEAYAERLFADLTPAARWFARMVYLGNLRFHFAVQEQSLERPHRWPMACTAGETSAVIDFDGRVRACELRQPIGNLRDHDMNFKVFWESSARKNEPAQIACDQCWCSHVCFIHDSLRYSPRALLWEVPKNFLQRGKW